MKTNYLYLMICMLFCCNHIYPQGIERGKEFTVDGATYIFTDEGMIANKNNKIKKMKLPVTSFDIVDNKPLFTLTKSLFTKKRSEEFTYGDRLGITFYCDSTGQVKEVEFLYSSDFDTIKVTPKEIKRMEDKLLNSNVGQTSDQAIRKADYYDLFWVFFIRGIFDDNHRENREKYRREKNQNKR